MSTDATRPTDDEVLEPLCSNCGGLGEISDGLSSATCRQCDGRGRLTTPQPHIAAEPGEVERVAWLIERRLQPPQWSCERDPTGPGAFYPDAQRAHRFPTKESAEAAMARMSITPAERAQYFVSEHSWINRPATYFGMDERSFEDFLADTIDGSLDMDWTGRIGAKAILAELATLTAPEPRTAGEGPLADENRRLDADLDREIANRDMAEEALSKAYLIVTGRDPQWSNLFTFTEALEEIDETIAALRQPPTDHESVRKAIEALANDYQTSDEHHPDHVLIPTSNFLTLCAEAGVVPHSENGVIEQRIAAIRALKASSKGGDHG